MRPVGLRRGDRAARLGHFALREAKPARAVSEGGRGELVSMETRTPLVAPSRLGCLRGLPAGERERGARP